MANGRLGLGVLVLFLAANACALEAKDLKRKLDRGGNWLVEQFDLKEKVFGKGEQAKDVTTVAMCVAALCDNPRDYKETNGPFISEPVKYILAQLNEDGTFKDANKNGTDAVAWVRLALESTANEKYRALCDKLKRAQGGELESARGKIGAPTDPSALRQSFIQVRALLASGKKEVEVVEGKTVKWGEVLAGNLLQLQQKNGSFGEDIRVNALTLNILNVCYKALQ